MAKDPDAFFKTEDGKNVIRSLSADEPTLFTNPAFRPQLNIFARDQREAIRQGDDGVEAFIQEIKLLKKGWDVDLSKIRAEVVYILHGNSFVKIPCS